MKASKIDLLQLCTFLKTKGGPYQAMTNSNEGLLYFKYLFAE